MSVRVGDDASESAAFFAAPRIARDIVQRQRQGVNDPAIAPPKPPRRADIADERSRMSEIAFGRTRNRSLLGTLNDFAFMEQSVDARRTEPESPEELVRFLSQTPILPLDGASPIALTRMIFEAK